MFKTTRKTKQIIDLEMRKMSLPIPFSFNSPNVDDIYHVTCLKNDLNFCKSAENVMDGVGATVYV